jgi:hypothetical protein
MGFTKNGVEVLVTKDGKLFSNIPSSQRTLDFHIRSLLYLDTYVESFVLLNVAVCWWSFWEGRQLCLLLVSTRRKKIRKSKRNIQMSALLHCFSTLRIFSFIDVSVSGLGLCFSDWWAYVKSKYIPHKTHYCIRFHFLIQYVTPFF